MGKVDEIEIRPATIEEMPQLGRLGSYVFGGAFGDGPDNVITQANLPEWTLCAFVGDRMVASSCAIPFTMRANGEAVALAGVSTVGTLPEFRRQGLARRLTTRSFEDMRGRGQSVAALWASQAAIYQRYGYSLATMNRSYRVDSVDIVFQDGDRGSGTVERLDVAKGYDIAKRIYIEYVADRICYLHRGQPLWLNNALAPKAQDGPIHIAVTHDSDGQPAGYLIYTLRSGRVDHPARSQEMLIRDFAWLTSDAYRSLWSWVACHDLVGRVVWSNAPIDDPATELILEPRLLNTRDHEGLWFRVVDVVTALGSRGYDEEGEITIQVTDDPVAPWNPGTYRLETSPDGAQVSTTTRSPDVRLSVKALASLYTSFRSARQLAAWGLLSGTDEATRRTDLLFAIPHSPHCSDSF